MPRFSILIRTKNESRRVRACLEALFAQTVAGDMEVLVLDSGSTDATLEIVRVHPVRVDTIPPESFTYPAAARTTSGRTTGCVAGR